ncbi:hypothetical protein ACQBAR_09085 [Propionibacteriaceae bacterium Y1685]|uniref:hypothetical protein n=1 Tax=Microlunatus sp. Y1700 TaxID=3418487 RepID=UPI003B7FA59D
MNGSGAGHMINVADPTAEYAWLGESPEEVSTGFDPDGWAASIWVLHAMYEDPTSVSEATVPDGGERRAGGEPGSARARVTGVQLGLTRHPGRSWRRLTWAELRTRTGATTPAVPPCHRWFPYSVWPTTIVPPGEGSLDAESLQLLITILQENSSEGADTECLASYALVPAGGKPDLWRGALRDVPQLPSMRPPGRAGVYDASPSNIWPVDRSWFVLTDWDLMGTKISGSAELISRLEAEPGLETTRWP